MKPWIQGGPFLEVSFLLESKTNKKIFVNDFFNKLSNIPQKFQMKIENLDDEIDKFSKGYPYDENDPNTDYIRSMEIPLLIDVSGERKSELGFQEISENTIQINFCFFGDRNDDPEWNQRGIKDEDMPEFTKFLSSIYEVFEFPTGMVSMMNNCQVLLFDCGTGWPNECYKLNNINMEKIIKNIKESYVIALIFDQDHFEVNNLPKSSTKIGKRGILIIN